MRDTQYVLAHLDTELELCELELSVLFWLKKKGKKENLKVFPLAWGLREGRASTPSSPPLSAVTFNHLLWQLLLSHQGKDYGFGNNLEGLVRC